MNTFMADAIVTGIIVLCVGVGSYYTGYRAGYLGCFRDAVQYFGTIGREK